ncbi:hypothetical protein [Streptomyces sp. 4F14]|uniref:hypothetical protein n=1 Tax=Streptomyces sp. 4F14 TaxID=3394380 RepID=UPI003A88CA5A
MTEPLPADVADALAPALPGTGVAVAVRLVTESGELPGELLLFTRNGYLSWLEVCSGGDDVDVTPAAALGRLRAATRAA